MLRRKLSLATVAALVVLMATALYARATPDGGKWALLVGVDAYDNPQITPLRCAGDDARALGQTLVRCGGFPEDHVVVMTSKGGPNERPTSINVLAALAGFQKAAKPGDEFVFFFSGHGVDMDRQSFLLTCDARLDSMTLLRKSALAVEDVKAALKEVKASRVMELLDACRNDPRSGKGAADNPLTEQRARDLQVVAKERGGEVDAAVTIFSCKVGQRSYEGYKGHGYFTYFLIKGLEGAAVRNDGKVTVADLNAYLERAVPEAVSLNERRDQMPWPQTDGPGAMSWVLSAPGGSAPPPPPERAQSNFTPPPPAPGPPPR